MCVLLYWERDNNNINNNNNNMKQPSRLFAVLEKRPTRSHRKFSVISNNIK